MPAPWLSRRKPQRRLIAARYWIALRPFVFVNGIFCLWIHWALYLQVKAVYIAGWAGLTSVIPVNKLVLSAESCGLMAATIMAVAPLCHQLWHGEIACWSFGDTLSRSSWSVKLVCLGVQAKEDGRERWRSKTPVQIAKETWDRMTKLASVVQHFSGN